MAARKSHVPKAPLGSLDGWRQRIETSKIINRLQAFINQELELSPAQVQAANILLKKVMPDITESETKVSGELTILRKVIRAGTTQ